MSSVPTSQSVFPFHEHFYHKIYRPNRNSSFPGEYMHLCREIYSLLINYPQSFDLPEKNERIEIGDYKYGTKCVKILIPSKNTENGF